MKRVVKKYAKVEAVLSDERTSKLLRNLSAHESRSHCLRQCLSTQLEHIAAGGMVHIYQSRRSATKRVIKTTRRIPVQQMNAEYLATRRNRRIGDLAVGDAAQ